MNDSFKQLSRSKYKENKKFFQKFPKSKTKELDRLALKNHNQVEKEINCLNCANCCKTVGPLFTSADIDRLARVFSMRPAAFMDQYLVKDHDDDYILKATPCPFLLEDNRCLVYEERPKACREFPHTDRKNQFQIRNLTLKNTLVCPIAFEVVERIKLSLC